MLYVGSGDGVHRVTGVASSAEPTSKRVLQSGRALRVRSFDGIDGLFAATKTGLYHTLDGDEWTDLNVPQKQVYTVGADPDGALYAGTRPAHVYTADASAATDAGDALEWRELDGFRELRSRDDWAIERHENKAQVRDVHVHPDAPDRVVAGVEVGGVYVSDDGGETWTDRCIEGFDAPHTDDIHHVELVGGDTFVAATGSGLYRSTDAGRTWTRLDAAYRQRYFRESFASDDALFAGGSPTSPGGWNDDVDHALFESRDGESLEDVPSPIPEEVVVGWCEHDSDLLAATHRGTLLRRGADGWRVTGSIPVADGVNGRCVPLAQFDP